MSESAVSHVVNESGCCELPFTALTLFTRRQEGNRTVKTCSQVLFLAGGGFFRLLLWARVQPTVDASTETLYRSSVLAQERRGTGRCMRVYA